MSQEQLEQRWINRERYSPSYNVSPGFYTPVVHVDGSGDRVVETMKWGLVPSFTKPEDTPDHFRMFNARSETVNTKPVFSRLLSKRRCVVLFEGFYEWKKEHGSGKKQPYYIYLRPEGQGEETGDRQQRWEPAMRMAGLFDVWKDAEGRQLATYTILTTDSSSRLKWIHDRMPALLTSDEAVSAWLGDKSEQVGDKLLGQVIAPYNGPELSWHPVTQAMSKPGYQAPDACRDTRASKGSITAFFARAGAGGKPKAPAGSGPGGSRGGTGASGGGGGGGDGGKQGGKGAPFGGAVGKAEGVKAEEGVNAAEGAKAEEGGNDGPQRQHASKSEAPQDAKGIDEAALNTDDNAGPTAADNAKGGVQRHAVGVAVGPDSRAVATGNKRQQEDGGVGASKKPRPG